jgi:hypothetical protein
MVDEQIRRQAAYVHGQWRVTYRRSIESGRHTDIGRGWIVGPLVSDPATEILWIAVMPDGNTQHIMIRRDLITSITSPATPRSPASSPAPQPTPYATGSSAHPGVRLA